MDEKLIQQIRDMEAAAARDVERAFCREQEEFATGQRAALRWVLSIIGNLTPRNRPDRSNT